MAQKPRMCPAGVAQHIVQRGNNRQTCFGRDADFAAYAHWLREASERFPVSVHAWVFMTNHVHLLATPGEPDSISGMMQHIGRRYVQYSNHQWGRTGTLWEGRFKSCLVQDQEYLLQCYRYIELNPVRAWMVDDSAEYRWSSYRANALGVESTLRTPHPEYLALGDDESRFANYRALFRAHVEDDLATEIRKVIDRGLLWASHASSRNWSGSPVGGSGPAGWDDRPRMSGRERRSKVGSDLTFAGPTIAHRRSQPSYRH